MPKYYAIRKGRTNGVICDSWSECQSYVTGFKGAVFKSFTTRAEAEAYIAPKENKGNEEKKDIAVWYTDGSKKYKCGGAAVDVAGKRVYYAALPGSEHSNNRGELLGVMLALLSSHGDIHIHTDSEYCINTLSNGYKPTNNFDLFDTIRNLMKGRYVQFTHVDAHTGITYNEVADTYADLATALDACESLQIKTENLP